MNVSDDADLRLVRVLAPSTSDPDGFERECAAAVADGDAATLLRTVIDSGAVSGLLRGADYTLDEAVSAFSLLTVYLDRVGDAAVGGELCGLLADAVAATTAAEPPDEPPGMREKSHGFIVRPKAEFSVELPIANSSRLQRPRGIAPAARNLRITVAS